MTLSTTDPLLRVVQLTKYFPIYGGVIRRAIGRIHAVDLISFELGRQETLGIVGESGCGKSTLGRTILKLQEPTSGQIWFEGYNISSYNRKAMREIRRKMQIIFQDPFFSLNPRHRVEKILREPLELHRIGKGLADRNSKIEQILEVVGLRPQILKRFPHEFSGGQRQRIGIARALLLQPELVVADEPVSALDVSIQSQILNLLKKLQRDFGLTYIFISHDLAVVEHISTKVAVMYLGEFVEFADRSELFSQPLHPYTQALISAIPQPLNESAKHRIVLQGDVPSAARPPQGCRFHTRCPFAFEKCKTEKPLLIHRQGTTSHLTACHLYSAAPVQS